MDEKVDEVDRRIIYYSTGTLLYNIRFFLDGLPFVGPSILAVICETVLCGRSRRPGRQTTAAVLLPSDWRLNVVQVSRLRGMLCFV